LNVADFTPKERLALHASRTFVVISALLQTVSLRTDCFSIKSMFQASCKELFFSFTPLALLVTLFLYVPLTIVARFHGLNAEPRWWSPVN
jgi:hypothetical protein